jgi:formylglycine-generating enzyme required for sulfatase activity
MGKYEGTQAKWREIMGNSPSTITGCGDNCPVVNVSWNDVQEFTRRLNERTGKIYRLPTEAEWEYAVSMGAMPAKSGTTRATASGSVGILRPIGWSQPNGLGIYDMLGSVWEWTGDKYGTNYYNTSPKNNPEGPAGGRYRALRGGSWDDTRTPFSRLRG